MDMKMRSEVIGAGSHPIWDVKVSGGVVPIISGREENLQKAVLAGFLEKGTIPNLPEAGVPWISYLTQEITFGEIDVAVRESLRKAGANGYQPEYELDGDRLTMSIGKIDNDTD